MSAELGVLLLGSGIQAGWDQKFLTHIPRVSFIIIDNYRSINYIYETKILYWVYIEQIAYYK